MATKVRYIEKGRALKVKLGKERRGSLMKPEREREGGNVLCPQRNQDLQKEEKGLLVAKPEDGDSCVFRNHFQSSVRRVTEHLGDSCPTVRRFFNSSKCVNPTFSDHIFHFLLFSWLCQRILLYSNSSAIKPSHTWRGAQL